jgi:hypothetical protein
LRRSATTLAVLVTALASSAALAEPSAADRALAESLFREGRALVEKENFAQACPKLAESQRLDPRPGTLLNLAICHEGEGRTASAWAEFSDAATQAYRAGQSEREKFASDHAKALEVRLTRLRIELAETPPALELRLDGRLLGQGSWSTALPLDPGRHQLTASAPGKRRWEHSFSLDPSPGIHPLRVPPLPDATSPLPAPSASAPAGTPADHLAPRPASSEAGAAPAEAQPWRRTAAITAAGAGAAFLVVGSIFGVRTISKHRDADAECDARGCTQAGLDFEGQARTAATVSTVGFALGLAGVGLGAYLLLTDGPPAPRPSASPRPRPLLGPGLAGLSLGGSF